MCDCGGGPDSMQAFHMLVIEVYNRLNAVATLLCAAWRLGSFEGGRNASCESLCVPAG